MKKPITIWEKYNQKKGRYEHNHIEDGHVNGDVPLARTEDQKTAWDNTYWRRKFGYIENGKTTQKEA